MNAGRFKLLHFLPEYVDCLKIESFKNLYMRFVLVTMVYAKTREINK